MPEEEGLNRLRAALHMARKSGSLLIGFRAVRQALHRKQCKLLLFAEDAGGSLLRMETGEVPVLRTVDRGTLGAWMGRKEISVLGLTDPNLAQAVSRAGEGLEEGRKREA